MTDDHLPVDQADSSWSFRRPGVRNERSEEVAMKGIHRARRIRCSGGILAELPGILLTLLASISAGEARRMTVLSSAPARRCLPS